MKKTMIKNTTNHITKKEFDTWEKLECIGKGTYGKVYKYYRSNKYLAVKIMRLHEEGNLDEEFVSNIYRIRYKSNLVVYY